MAAESKNEEDCTQEYVDRQEAVPSPSGIALGEIVEDLKLRRRYIVPYIRNLDTGETYSQDEATVRIPQGVDPSQLSKDTRRLDMGTLICNPVLHMIPRSVSPNAITLFNHPLNWIIFGLAVWSTHEIDVRLRIMLLVICAGLNFLSMMLDCLDGMHARNTRQTSRLGEALDHWMDAIHVPLVAGGIIYALGMEELSKWIVVFMVVFNIALYNVQLIKYHYQRVFVQTAGVEGQIMTSGIYILLAFIVTMDPAYHGRFWTAVVFAVAGFAVMPILWLEFVRDFSRVEWEKHLIFLAVAFAGSLLYIKGACTLVEYMLFMAFLSFRVTGSYVLHSILQQSYEGIDMKMVVWFSLLAFTHFCMLPLPITTFYARIIPVVGDLTGTLTVQRALPFVICVETICANMNSFAHAYRRLLYMK